VKQCAVVISSQTKMPQTLGKSHTVLCARVSLFGTTSNKITPKGTKYFQSNNTKLIAMEHECITTTENIFLTFDWQSLW
jgi:hypothetical protein